MEENMIVIRDPKPFCYHKKQWIFSRDYNKERGWAIMVKI